VELDTSLLVGREEGGEKVPCPTCIFGGIVGPKPELTLEARAKATAQRFGVEGVERGAEVDGMAGPSTSLRMTNLWWGEENRQQQQPIQGSLHYASQRARCFGRDDRVVVG